MARFKPNPRVTAELTPHLASLLEGCAQFVETEAKRRVPYQTGNLRRSIDHRVAMDPTPVATVAAVSNYAAHVEFGTSPHTILPSNKKALFWPGARHPVRGVSHPGTQPQPFFRPALLALRGYLRGGAR